MKCAYKHIFLPDYTVGFSVNDKYGSNNKNEDKHKNKALEIFVTAGGGGGKIRAIDRISFC